MLFHFVDKHERMPAHKEKYNDVCIKLWLQDQKKKIHSTEDKMYKVLSVNKIIKKELNKYIDKKKSNKDKKEYTFDEKLKILFDFVDKYKRVPTYKEQYNDVIVGQWLHTQKSKIHSAEDEMYKVLSVNKIIKKELNKYIDKKESNKDKKEYTFNEKLKILFDFVDKYKRVPMWKEQHNDVFVGQFLNSQKTKIQSTKDEIYKLLSVNKIIKKELDRYIANKELNKDKKEYTFDEKLKMLYDFVDEHKRVPAAKEQYSDVKIGMWLHHKKKKIHSTEDEIYKLLSSNEIVKKSLDNYITKKSTKKVNASEQSELSDDDSVQSVIIEKKPKKVIRKTK
jgi:hypothetical protein